MFANILQERKFRPVTFLVSVMLANVALNTARADDVHAPKGPVEITVGTSAGGTPDMVMRRVAKVLNDTGIVSNPIVIQNRTGGSWVVAANWVLNKKGDENTLLAVAGPIFTTPIVQGLPTIYDKVTPIALFVQGELVVAVQPDLPINSLKDLIAEANKKERTLKVAGANVGATDQIVAGMIQKVGNIKLNYIPFDGGGAAQTAFLGKNVDLITLSVSEAMPLAKSGKLKIIALLSENRRTDDFYKNIPTAREQGYDLVFFQSWGVMGPPDTDPGLVAWWADKFQKMVDQPEFKKMIEDNYFKSQFMGPEEAKAFMQNYQDEHLTILRELGISKL